MARFRPQHGSQEALKRFQSCLKECYGLRPKKVLFEVRFY